jgi:hypothetical protein
MKNPDNPINRFARYLGKGAQNVADDLGMGLSNFQKQSANNPEELKKVIEEKTSFSFAKDNQSILRENISPSEKTLVCADLLTADTKKKNAFRNNDLRINGNVRIFKNFLPGGTPHYIVEDIEAGTPLSPGGNLLTQEFSQLLYVDDKALAKLGRLSPVISLDVQAIGQKCPEYANGKLTIAHLIEALKKELAQFMTTLGEERFEAIRFMAEVAIIEGIFEKLKLLYSKDSALDERDSQLYERYKDWFCSQFNLSKKNFLKAMSTGRIIIFDARGRSVKEAQLNDIAAEYLGILLVFGDEFPAFSLSPVSQ